MSNISNLSERSDYASVASWIIRNSPWLALQRSPYENKENNVPTPSSSPLLFPMHLSDRWFIFRRGKDDVDIGRFYTHLHWIISPPFYLTLVGFLHSYTFFVSCSPLIFLLSLSSGLSLGDRRRLIRKSDKKSRMCPEGNNGWGQCHGRSGLTTLNGDSCVSLSFCVFFYNTYFSFFIWRSFLRILLY